MSEEAYTSRIVHIDLDRDFISRRSPEIGYECKVAMIDLVDDNTFTLVEHPGMYRVHLSIRENRLVFDIQDTDMRPLKVIVLSLTPFRSLIKDYGAVCRSYFEAIKTASPDQIEAIDVGRRGLHNDGAHLLTDRLKNKVQIDWTTSRRLFTLLCALTLR